MLLAGFGWWMFDVPMRGSLRLFLHVNSFIRLTVAGAPPYSGDMIDLTGESFENLKERIGMDTATLLVSPDDEDRHFIGEHLLVAAVLFLVQQYFTGVVKGLGIEDAGEKTGKAIRTGLESVGRRLNAALDSGQVSPAELDEARRELQGVADGLERQDVEESSKQEGERRVEAILVEHGAVDEQGRTAGAAISRALFGKGPR